MPLLAVNDSCYPIELRVDSAGFVMDAVIEYAPRMPSLQKIQNQQNQQNQLDFDAVLLIIQGALGLAQA